MSTYYYSTLYSESFRRFQIGDFQGNVQKNEKQNKIHQILLVTYILIKKKLKDAWTDWNVTNPKILVQKTHVHHGLIPEDMSFP